MAQLFLRYRFRWLFLSIWSVICFVLALKSSNPAGQYLLLGLGLLFWLVSLWVHTFGQGKTEEIRYLQQLDTLSQVASILNSSLDQQQVLVSILDQLTRVVGYDGVSLLLYEEGNLSLVAYKNLSDPSWRFVHQTVFITPTEQKILDTHQPVVVSNTEIDPTWHALNPSQGVRSWLGTPMIIDGRLIGLINLSKKQSNFYSDQDAFWVSIFANHSATAIRNAKLYAQIQEELAERRKFEEALQESEQNFRSLFETMTQGVICRDAKGRVITANQAAFDILGQESLEQMNNAYENGMPAPLIGANGQPIAEEQYPSTMALRTGRTVKGISMRIFNPRLNSYRWILLDAVPRFRPGDEHPFMTYAIFEDVTEKWLTSQALQENESRFRSLFETMNQGVLYYSPAGQLISINPAGAKLLHNRISPEKLAPAEANPNPTWQMLREDGTLLPAEERPFWQVLKTGQPIFDFILGIEFFTTQETRWYAIDTIPQFRPQETTPFQIYSMFRDITESRQAEEALRQAQKLESLGILAGGIAHDFNNLLVAMLGQNSLALQKLPGDVPGRANIEKAIKAAESAASLTRQMLAYSGRGHFEVKQINLNQLIQENIDLLRVAVPKQIHMTTDLATHLPLISADVSQIQQVIMNLILNAAEAIHHHHGLIVLQTSTKQFNGEELQKWQIVDKQLSPGFYVQLVVQDNGKGLRPEQLARIFDPFFTTKTTGRGLGLAAVLGIVRGHQGGLKVVSTPDVGTIFTLIFPATHSAVPLPTPVPAPDQRKTALTGTVLVIDDEAPVREVVSDILTTAGFSVLMAPNGEEGLLLYQEAQATIDVVLIDWSMPMMNGSYVLRRLRQLNPAVVALLSSGYTEADAIHLLDEQKPNGFLQKPYQAQQLLEAVYQCLLLKHGLLGDNG